MTKPTIVSLPDVTINGRSFAKELEALLKNVPSWVPPESVRDVQEVAKLYGVTVPSEDNGNSDEHR